MGAGGNEGAVRADVVVLTALEVEYRAVRAHLEDPRPVRAERGALFELGVFRDGSAEWTVAIHMTGPGNPGAAASVERAAALFAPRALLFVGVAGGVKDVALGDVVAADAVYDYETGKDTESGFLPRQKTHQSAYGLVQLARLVTVGDAWQRRIRPGDDAPRPNAHVKPLAAGGRVVAHHRSDVGLRLTAGAGDALAVDMEGFGFLAGAYLNQQLDALVIRGISDLLGDKGEAHDERWQPVASRHAAAFAFELIGRMPVAADAPADQPRAAAARTPAAKASASSAEASAPTAEASATTADTPATTADASAPTAEASALAAGTRSLAPDEPAGTPTPAAGTRPLAAGAGPGRPRRRLTVRDLGVLAETLLAVSGMTSPARWQQLLDELPTVGTAVSRQSAGRAEALSLLRTCETRRAMGELVEVVAVLAPDDPAAAEFARRVEEFGLE
ncbi:phosphorylase family protein [Streptomyces malaysiensis]|uniref:phosphorylase family protein n=1 Tax=Streptomyces malaysiensis TaxID=92644 RepID=UPI00340D2301